MARSGLLLPVVFVATGTLLLARSLSRCFAAGGALAHGGIAGQSLGKGQRVLRVARASSAGIEEAKERLMDLLEDGEVQAEALKAEGRATRGRVNEAVVQLERLNPTDEPVYSERLDGTWVVKYTSSYAPGLFESPTRELALFLYGGGFSLGSALSSFAEGFWGNALNVKLGSKKVRINAGRDVDAVAEFERGGSKDELKYSAELMPLSSQRMSEEIMSVELPPPVGKQDLPLEIRRTILITYLDEDLMIVRDESGVPEVLKRELASVKVADPVATQANTVAAQGNSSADEQGDDPLIALR